MYVELGPARCWTDFDLKIIRWAHLMQLVEVKTVKKFLSCHFYQYFTVFKNVVKIWYTFEVVSSNIIWTDYYTATLS
jgi:hypothetical protein